MKLYRVDVSAYSNNAIRKPDGRFYMAHEADAEIDALIHDNARLYKSLNGEMCERLRLEAENERMSNDVRRYQWLKEHLSPLSLGVLVTTKRWETLDEFIDIATNALPDTKGE